MNLLRIVSSVDRAHGGVAEALFQSSKALERLGHKVQIISLDAPGSQAILEAPVDVIALGPGVGTFGYSSRLDPWLTREASAYDALIVEGLWQYHGQVGRRAALKSNVPYFVFTHGMLDPWFKRTYPLKHLKKSAYWLLFEQKVLRDASAVLFTTQAERELASESFKPYRVVEQVVGCGTRGTEGSADDQQSAFNEAFPDLVGKPFFLFLGRINPKKGCDLLIDAFGRMSKSIPEMRLVMAGPDDANWGHDLRLKAAALGIGERVLWPGMLKGDIKWGAFRNADAFILPSHQENFGVAVAEALSVSCPVLISDQVNIWQEIDSAGAGFVQPDSVEGCEALFSMFIELDDEKRSAMRLAARQCFDQHFEATQAARKLAQVIGEFL